MAEELVKDQETESECQWAVFTRERGEKWCAPRAGVLGLELFKLFISDLERRKVAGFTGNTKLF